MGCLVPKLLVLITLVLLFLDIRNNIIIIIIKISLSRRLPLNPPNSRLHYYHHHFRSVSPSAGYRPLLSAATLFDLGVSDPSLTCDSNDTCF